jgi:repressor LexA
VREIARGIGFSSPASVQVYLNSLEEKGYLKRWPGHRGLEVIIYPPEVDFKERRSVPLVGRVAAGQPTIAFENIEDYLPFSAQIAPEGSFFLRVEGDSMIRAGILHNDLVLVKPQPTANNGDIVVALVDGETTVKRLRTKRNRVFLEPANPNFKPIEIKRGEIIGKVIAVWRSLA